MLYSLRAHAHYFTVFIYLETWIGAKLGIFTHFTFINLPRCSQSMNSLIYAYFIQIPSWSQSRSHFFVLPTPKEVYCIIPWWVFVFDLGISTNKDRVSTQSRKSGNLLDDREKSGKSQGRKFLSMQIFNFSENHMHAEMCAVELHMKISCVYDMMLLFPSSIKII